MADLTKTASLVKQIDPKLAETYDGVLPSSSPPGYGDACFFSASTGRLTKSNAGAAATARFHGLVVHRAGSGATILKRGRVAGFDLSGLSYGDKVYLSAATAGALADAPPAILNNEVQTLTISGTPTGGTYTLTYRGATTSAIAHNANAATIQAALEALDTIDAVDVAGSGPFTITFPASAGDVALIVGDGSSLTGGTDPAATVVETTAGVDAATEAVATVVPMSDHDLTKVLYVDAPSW